MLRYFPALSRISASKCARGSRGVKVTLKRERRLASVAGRAGGRRRRGARRREASGGRVDGGAHVVYAPCASVQRQRQVGVIGVVRATDDVVFDRDALVEIANRLARLDRAHHPAKVSIRL